jgi:hypothetical protein
VKFVFWKDNLGCCEEVGMRAYLGNIVPDHRREALPRSRQEPSRA